MILFFRPMLFLLHALAKQRSDCCVDLEEPFSEC